MEKQSIVISDKKKCFACNETSHGLDQCRIKYNLVSAAQLFGHATRFPFYTIQPSEEAVDKEKFHHHCLLIASNISNLDPTKVKDELQKSWKLSSGWELRRECRKTFLASFDSENDLISCLKNPMMETYLDGEEVKFTVTRWTDGESVELNRQWFSVRGVPRIYRNWKELYQVASAFGVLIGVDEESLEFGDTEPIRLKIALRNFDDAPFSHHFVFGWSCRLVTFTTEGKGKDTNEQKELGEQSGKAHLDAFNTEFEEKRNKVVEIPAATLNKGTTSENSSNSRTIASPGILLEGPKRTEQSRFDGEIKENKINAPDTTTINSKKTTVDSPKSGVQSISRSLTSITGEEHFRGIPKPPSIQVYRRRGKKQQVTEVSNESPLNKQDKIMGLESSNHDTRTGASTGCHMSDYKSCPEKEHKKELNVEETAPVEESPKSEKKDKNGAPVAAKINSKKNQISEDSSKTESTQFTGGRTKGFGIDGMAPGVQIHENQYASKMGTRLSQNSKEVTTDSDISDSFSKKGLLENLLKGVYQYGLEKPSAVQQRGIVSLGMGLDVIQQSLSGTTVTICFGVLQRLDYGSAECQALVLVPTRDIAQETEKVIQSLGQCLGVKAHACTGGYSAHTEQQILSSRVQVLIGTSGRVLDVLQRQAVCPDHIAMFVLDEANELLTGRSKGQIYRIMRLLLTKIQVGVFTPTFSNEALAISRKFMDKPVTIIVPIDEELKGININQFYVKVDMEELKLSKLCDFVDMMVVTQSIIFVTTRHKVKPLIEQIRGKGITVLASHGGMHQHARDTAIQEFRSGSSRILITTDLRCTDVVQAPVVINYDLPTHPVHYVCHVLHNGQSERKGVVISFITYADECNLSDIQRLCNSQIGELPSKIASLPIGYGVQKQN